MGSLIEIELSIPLIQILFLLMASTIAVLFRKLKVALIVNYCFCLYWAYFLNRDRIADMGPEKFTSFALIYFGLGVVFLMGAIIGFLFHNE